MMTMVAGLLVDRPLPAHASVSVQMEDFRFNPRNELLAQGAQLTWINSGTVNHTSTQDGPCVLEHGPGHTVDVSNERHAWAAGRYHLPLQRTTRSCTGIGARPGHGLPARWTLR